MATKIETERLILREAKMSDAETITRLIGNYEVAKTLSRVPHPYTIEDANWFLDKQLNTQDKDSLFLVIEVKDGPGHLIGAIGLHGEEEADGETELGYWIGESYWGNGYVSEAALAMVDHGFEAMGLQKIYAGYFIDNLPSKRILDKCGFQEIRIREIDSVSQGCKVVCPLMSLTCEDWKKQNQ